MKTSKKSGKPRSTTLQATIIPFLIIILAAALVGGSNYLVNFAIGPGMKSTNAAGIMPASTLTEEDIQGITDNWKVISEQARTWTASVSSEEVHITSRDGLDLFGETYIADGDSHLWVIGVHGYRGNHTQMAGIISNYGIRGYNALLPDLRACGQSEGKFVGMGWLDRLDMLEWINWIIERDSQAQIILHGISMGGATVMMTAGESLPPQVKAIVEDCGYTSVWDIFEDELSYMFHLPAFPILHIGSLFSSVSAGYGFAEASALNQVRNAQVPILFIHGAEDNFVHTDMVYPLYDACASEKELLVVEHAGHGSSYIQDPSLYFDTVFQFIESYIE